MGDDRNDTAHNLGDVLREWADSRLEHRYVHEDIQCDNCHGESVISLERVRSSNKAKAITGARHRCETCNDFDLCSECFTLTTDEPIHDGMHEFYLLQYFRLDVPPAKGEDLVVIRKFLEGGSSENFYLHYPWLFNSRIFDKLIFGTANEDYYRTLIGSILQDMDQDESELRLDSFIRTCTSEDWNHSAVFNEVEEIARLQQCRAEGSQYFYSTWQRLSASIQSQTPNLSRSYIEQRKALLRLALEERDSANIIAILRAYCEQRDEEWSQQASGIMTSNMSPRARYFYSLVFGTEVVEGAKSDQEFPVLQASDPLPKDVEDLLKQQRVIAGSGEVRYVRPMKAKLLVVDT